MPRKLTPPEINALRYLDRTDRPLCPGTATGEAAKIAHLLNGLHRRNLVDREDTDDGPAFALNSDGQAEARK